MNKCILIFSGCKYICSGGDHFGIVHFSRLVRSCSLADGRHVGLVCSHVLESNDNVGQLVELLELTQTIGCPKTEPTLYSRLCSQYPLW